MTHVYPLGDLREHELTVDCWCEPLMEEGDVGVLVIHNSMDRREEYEEGRKPS